MDKTVMLPARETEVYGKADVLVVGGGMAGIGARHFGQTVGHEGNAEAVISHIFLSLSEKLPSAPRRMAQHACLEEKVGQAGEAA